MSAYAVDAVVVQREDGTRQATAFHVRFEPTTRAQLRRSALHTAHSFPWISVSV